MRALAAAARPLLLQSFALSAAAQLRALSFISRYVLRGALLSALLLLFLSGARWVRWVPPATPPAPTFPRQLRPLRKPSGAARSFRSRSTPLQQPTAEATSRCCFLRNQRTAAALTRSCGHHAFPQGKQKRSFAFYYTTPFFDIFYRSAP